MGTGFPFLPGFRFHPTHVELIMFYLKKRVMNKKLPKGIISELDIYKYDPWDLPEKSCLNSGDLKWYFFCPRERKYASGARMKRATEAGYWKSTGRDRSVHYNNEIVGQIKTLTFFRGKAPKGEQTDWVMHEYRIEQKSLSEKNVAQDAYVLCVVFEKDGPGPRNGAQYGAPFKEEEWDEDGLYHLGVNPSDGVSAPSLQPGEQPQSSLHPENSVLSGSSISEIMLPTSKEISKNAGGDIAPMEITHIDDIISLEDLLPEDGSFELNHGDDNQTNQNVIPENCPAPKYLDQNDIFKDLEDLDVRANEGGNAHIIGDLAMCSSDPMLFLELNDLETPLTCTAEGTNIQSTSLAAELLHPPTLSLDALKQPVSSSQYLLTRNGSNDQACYSADVQSPI